ncbi:acetyltransferase, GNAT family [Synechococcus sp. PCC 7335]|uniref:GNAT family N-acetyltransferase n=1 Tax=Synechococcus sp. (strain ATCC 29403 / PCC 7335) TaxID=91464 RepID=UPI00017EB196|nr:GNAT family N-acetyltransferase [Synechococcus sp. PCC 7335]EDX83051.1 acetyltransferase, GNAT family [Synechococcus sp. PCC 7335]
MTRLRRYDSEDWDAIAEIHDRTRLDELNASVGTEAFLSLAATAEEEELFAGEVWVTCDDHFILGFVAFADNEVNWLYVSPDYYRQGIGRLLLRHAINRCGKTVGTSVLSDNNAALQLYLSEGFQIVETETGKLAGNEAFSATGHVLELDKQLLKNSKVTS